MKPIILIVSGYAIANPTYATRGSDAFVATPAEAITSILAPMRLSKLRREKPAS
ncbi:MAG: hypothetical protein Kow0065_03790 [Methylomicrobium sp.]